MPSPAGDKNGIASMPELGRIIALRGVYDEAMFDLYLARWRLRPDGAAIHTHGSDLLPVTTADGAPAMLKLARWPEERAGAALMRWWNGDGAARVLAADEDALLMERATSVGDLLQDAIGGGDKDDHASEVICGVLDRLHAPRSEAPPPLGPLADWFGAVRTQAARHGGVLAHCARLADALLAEPQETVALHGDPHHGNVLDFARGDWRAIDPKDRIGERGFDHAQILCNPDLPSASDPVRMARQWRLVAKHARLEPLRLLRWTAAHAALSAAWTLEDEDMAAAAHELATAETALRLLADAGESLL